MTMRLAEATRARLVTALKIALPLTALAVLSTLFMFARVIDPSRALPYASVDVEDLLRDPRIAAPRFAGVTDDGAALTFTAEAVRVASGAGETTTADGIAAVLETPDGQRTILVADHAAFDRRQETVLLRGDVRLVTAEGYDLRMPSVQGALDRTWLRAEGPVTGTGPPGRIEAAAVELHPVAAQADGAGGHELVFTGGVRLIYLPQSGE